MAPWAFTREVWRKFEVKLFRGSATQTRAEHEDVVDVVDTTTQDPAVVEEIELEQPEVPVRVLLVDDDEEVRFVLRIALDSAGFDVVGDAGDAESAMELVVRTQPDIVLLDLHMPDIGGLEILPLILEDSPLSKVVVCSAISATYMTEAALKEGAWGYIVKGVSAKSITEHLLRVAESGSVKPIRPFPLSRDYEHKDRGVSVGR